jgi:hypothetical protein
MLRAHNAAGFSLPLKGGGSGWGSSSVQQLTPIRNYRALVVRIGATRRLSVRPHLGQANAFKPY